METPQPKKPSRRRRKASVKPASAPSPDTSKLEQAASSESSFADRMNDFHFEVMDPEPVVEPKVEENPAPEPAPKLKPWELVRPMVAEDKNAWQRGQKWRP